MKRLRFVMPIVCAMLLTTAGAAWCIDYLTEGADSSRTGWLRGEKGFNLENVRGTKLLWKLKLDTTPREMQNLFPPLIAESVSTPSGPKQIAIVTAASDDLFGIDVETGKQLWHTHFDPKSAMPTRERAANVFCPGGISAVPVMKRNDVPGSYTVYAVSSDGWLRSINPTDGSDAMPPAKFIPPGGKPFALNLYKNVIYTSVAQGCGGFAFSMLSYDLTTRIASIFLPSGGGLWGRRGVTVSSQDVAYMGTGDGVWDPEAGHFGDGLIAAKIGRDDGLHLEDYFAPLNAAFLYKRDLDINVSPVAVDYKGRHLLVGSSKECRLWLLDRDNFGGEDHRMPLDSSRVCNDDTNFQSAGVWGAMSAWQDAKGEQWLAVPFYGAVSKSFHAPQEYGRPVMGGVAAFRIEEKGGKWVLSPQWLSGDMNRAETSLFANGVLFAYASGEDSTQVPSDTAWNEERPRPPAIPGISPGTALRVSRSGHAEIYAFDAASGKLLWDSGDQVKSFNHFSGFSAANGRLYLPTWDGTVYCFGVAR